MTQSEFDVIVVGGGIAGVSIASELSSDRSVCLVEMESSLAFHTTGRSAATFLETYGGPNIRALTTGSREFLTKPPAEFEQILMTPRPLLQFAKQGRESVIEELHRDVLPLVPDAELVDEARMMQLFPLLRPGFSNVGMYEPGAMELDVLAIHGGYVRTARQNGAEIHKGAKVERIEREDDGRWSVTTSDGETRRAPLVVNAAGAWADVVAEAAGVRQIGLRPLLRTIFMVSSPGGAGTKDLPILGDIDQAFYVKPEGEQFLCSPADETPSEPKDAKPDSLEISRAIDEVNDATTIGVKGVSTSWGGLRSFVPDRNFVVGEDPEAAGFFWFAGQGGYGIQTAPATARLGAALARGEQAPQDLLDRGLDPLALVPHRPGMLVDAGH
ncbi:FAD-binding oxidoreductase [Aeromicrobium sp. HA]|uniref:NAD(P)/FAD-dependent oxidoreductase n=1 Tax=unclassified Aeromicrobium TaxID=2633570 RepID=UPI0022AE86D7|nr:FAD-binding oxidoreductase [Aeromicrobium sp. HA]